MGGPISRRRYFLALFLILFLVVGLPPAIAWALRTVGCNNPDCEPSLLVPAEFVLGWLLPLLGALAAGLLVFTRGRATGLGWWWAVLTALVLPTSLLISPFGALTMLSLGLPPLFNPSGQISAFGSIVVAGLPGVLLPALLLLVAGIADRIPRDGVDRVIETAAIIAALYILPSIVFGLIGPLLPFETTMTLEDALIAMYPDGLPVIPLAILVIELCLIYVAVRSWPTRHRAEDRREGPQDLSLN